MQSSRKRSSSSLAPQVSRSCNNVTSARQRRRYFRYREAEAHLTRPEATAPNLRRRLQDSSPLIELSISVDDESALHPARQRRRLAPNTNEHSNPLNSFATLVLIALLGLCDFACPLSDRTACLTAATLLTDNNIHLRTQTLPFNPLLTTAPTTTTSLALPFGSEPTESDSEYDPQNKTEPDIDDDGDANATTQTTTTPLNFDPSNNNADNANPNHFVAQSSASSTAALNVVSSTKTSNPMDYQTTPQTAAIYDSTTSTTDSPANNNVDGAAADDDNSHDLLETMSAHERNDLVRWIMAELRNRRPIGSANRMNASAAVMAAARLVELTGSEIQILPPNSLPAQVETQQTSDTSGGNNAATINGNNDSSMSPESDKPTSAAPSSSAGARQNGLEDPSSSSILPPPIASSNPQSHSGASSSSTSSLPGGASQSSLSFATGSNTKQTNGSATMPNSMSSSNANAANPSTQNVPSQNPRPYFGDAFYSFQTVYWPIHCVICLVICTLGIFANVTNIIVLTRPNMITAVNTILSAMAFSDLIVNVSNIPYLMHELSDSNDATAYFSYKWAVYILLHAHITVTAHTISIWLTCVLATWRYLVVCRTQSSYQRNWTINLALRAILAVVLFVPLFCIPNYLSFSIVKERAEMNTTLFKVGFSELAESSQFIRTFHFSIFSILTKLVPCVLLTFFTTVLIRKLLQARERRLRLTSFGAKDVSNISKNRACSLYPGEAERRKSIAKEDQTLGDNVVNGNGRCDYLNNRKEGTENNKGKHEKQPSDIGLSLVEFGAPQKDSVKQPDTGESNEDYSTEHKQITRTSNIVDDATKSQAISLTQHDDTCYTRDGTDCSIPSDSEQLIKQSAGNDNATLQQSSDKQFHKSLNQLIVESTTGESNHTITTTMSNKTAPNQMIVSCDTKTFASIKPKIQSREMGPRSASTCGALEHCSMMGDCQTHQRLPMPNQRYLIEQHSPMGTRRSPLGRSSLSASGCNSPTRLNNDMSLAEKRASEATIDSRGRPVGRTTLLPFQFKIQTNQRQLSQNETTTRLLIAVMIVFLICEFPAGILAALCAILGQEFFDNVYQPVGLLTDLLALINSAVNFILYCFMSTQFRVTFYQVVLRCPAPSMPKQQLNNISRGPKDFNTRANINQLKDDDQNKG